jgi:superfamily II DNA or RNA helicase
MSLIKGEYPKKAVHLATSYPVEGARFSKAYKKGRWDGRKKLLDRRSGAFPTGLLNAVIVACGTDVSVTDHRSFERGPNSGSFDLAGIKMEGKYSYQLDACKKAVEKRQGIIRVATNGGKCLGLGTPVRMFDGSVKVVEELEIGDQLMGPDNEPRTVQSTCRGQGPLYLIKPARGMAWICNDVHVLTLQHTATEEVVDIALDEYLEETDTFKHCYKQFSVGVEYPAQSVPVDPYFIGLWLGDGTKSLKSVQVTTMDQEVVDHLTTLAKSWGCEVREDDHKNNKSSTYRLVTPRGKPNPLLTEMRTLFRHYGEIYRPAIPPAYHVNSRDVRLQVLAGIIDSDGHAHEGRYYEVIQKDRDFAEEIYTLARSLGFGASMKHKRVNDQYYWRINILGAGPGDIPVRLPRKQITQPRQKSPTRTKFDVSLHKEQGQYAGFTLDGDGRFLLSDYTVTHNTEIACAITKYLDLPTLFIVPSIDLLYQGRARFAKRLGVPENTIGVIGDANWDPKQITIATADTLQSRIDRKECVDFLQSQKVLFIDECHHAGSETWYQVITLCEATYRYGLSGTPLDRTDGANLRLIAATGELIVDISNEQLVTLGVSAPGRFIFDRVSKPILNPRARYDTVYREGVVENEELNNKVVEWLTLCRTPGVFKDRPDGLNVLVLIEELKHGRTLDDLIWEVEGKFIPHQFIHGEEDSEVRTKALADFSNGSLPVLISSRILDEGVDVPTIDVLMVPGSRKSRIKTMQRIGRGLRGDKLIVIEFANFCHRYLLEHSLQRLEDVKNEKVFTVTQSRADLPLLIELWNDPKSSKAYFASK